MVEASKNLNGSKINLRSYKFDNLKGLGIILVILGHFIGTFYTHPFISLKNFIYFWHIPLLFFVSGYLTKVNSDTEINSLKRILIPYLLFSTFWFGVMLLGGHSPKTPYLGPIYGLWYLLTLFTLRFFLKTILKIKHIFILSIIIAICFGWFSFPSDFLSITRTFYFLPIFLLGYYFKNTDEFFSIYPKVHALSSKLKKLILRNKKISFLVLLLFFGFVLFVIHDWKQFFFLNKYSYSFLGYGIIQGSFMRLFMILSSFLIVILLTYLMIDKNIFLTKIGRNSLAVYVLHFYVLVLLRRFLFPTDFGIFIWNNLLLLIIFIIFSVLAIAYVLSRDFITNSIQWLLNFINSKIFSS